MIEGLEERTREESAKKQQINLTHRNIQKERLCSLESYRKKKVRNLDIHKKLLSRNFAKKLVSPINEEFWEVIAIFNRGPDRKRILIEEGIGRVFQDVIVGRMNSRKKTLLSISEVVEGQRRGFQHTHSEVVQKVNEE